MFSFFCLFSVCTLFEGRGWVSSSNAQGLLLTRLSGVTTGGAWGPREMLGLGPGSAACRASPLPALLSSYPSAGTWIKQLPAFLNGSFKTSDSGTGAVPQKGDGPGGVQHRQLEQSSTPFPGTKLPAQSARPSPWRPSPEHH